jgi:hypothetical protein
VNPEADSELKSYIWKTYWGVLSGNRLCGRKKGSTGRREKLLCYWIASTLQSIPLTAPKLE